MRASSCLVFWTLLTLAGSASAVDLAGYSGAASHVATAALLETPLRIVDGVETYTVPRANLAISRDVVASGPGWVRQTFDGVAGALEFTDEADYFVVSDLAGIDAVPLTQMVGAEFGAFLKDKLRENALTKANPAERVYILQKSALQAAEPLFLDREQIALDPYAYLDVTICVPNPIVGGIAAPVFSPEVLIREIAPGVLEYSEAIDTSMATDLANVPLGNRIGSVDLNAVRSVASVALPGGAAPSGAVAQSASAGGGMTCFNLLDTIGDGGGDSCKIDPFDPSSWYHEYKAKGTVDLNLPSTNVDVTLDSTEGVGATLLGSKYEGTIRYATEDRFQEVDGRKLGGTLEVGVGSLFCVPLWLRPVEARLWAHFESRREIELHGTLKHSTSSVGQVTSKADGSLQATRLDGELPDPYTLAELTLPEPAFMIPIAFPVGPVPVLLILDAPVEIGVIAGVDSPTFTNFEAEAELTLGFDYACRFGGSCTAKNPFYADASFGSGVSGDAGLEGRAFVKLYAGMSLRASLYFPGAIYAKVGPRAYMNFELWGAAKLCGDADGNGQEEWVSALTLDHDAGIELIGEIGIYDIVTGISVVDSTLGLLPAVPFPIGDPINWHLGFTNLLNQDGKAFQPMLVVPTSVQEDQSAALSARMRPCYPYADEMQYGLDYGDGTHGGSAEGDPDENASAVHTWANPGSYSVRVTAQSDAHGRVFDEVFGTSLVTSLSRPVVVNATPVVVVKPPVKGVPLRR